jgi:hypothetical protein
MARHIQKIALYLWLLLALLHATMIKLSFLRVMCKHAKTVAAILIAGCFIQCNRAPKTATISGEVFIVTKDSSNVRLGAVQVALFSGTAIAQWATNKNTQAGEIGELLKKRAEAQEKKVQTWSGFPLHEQIVEQDKKIRAMMANAGVRLDPVRPGGLEKVVETDHRMKQYATDLAEKYRADAEMWPTAEFYFLDLPPPLTTTRTDADGKFSATVPFEKDVVIGIRAQRESQNEEYFWLIKVDLADQNSRNVLLSNHDLLTSSSDESVFRAVGTKLNYPIGAEPEEPLWSY